jgi:hypothetical protein
LDSVRKQHKSEIQAKSLREENDQLRDETNSLKKDVDNNKRDMTIELQIMNSKSSTLEG